MTTPVAPRSAADLLAAHAATEAATRRRWQRRGVIGAGVLLALGLLAWRLAPPSELVRGDSGRQYHVQPFQYDAGIGRMGGLQGLGEAVVVRYVAPTGSAPVAPADLLIEFADMAAAASPVARLRGDSLVVLMRNEAPLGRWHPLVRGRVYFLLVDPRTGEWRVAPRG